MKATTLKNRLDRKYNGSKTSKAYQIVKDLINGTKETYMVFDSTIRPCKTSGSGRFTTNMDYTMETKRLLTLLGIKFKSGNDAPRGGFTGNYITVLTKIEHEQL